MTYDHDTIYKFNRFAASWFATAGVMNTAEEKGCFWLLDVIASYANTAAVKNADYFKIAKATLNGQGGCVFTLEDEISGVLITQEIPYTDLDVDLKLWAITEDDRTLLLLPEEY